MARYWQYCTLCIALGFTNYTKKAVENVAKGMNLTSLRERNMPTPSCQDFKQQNQQQTPLSMNQHIDKRLSASQLGTTAATRKVFAR
jgi:hypothetical protein